MNVRDAQEGDVDAVLVVWRSAEAVPSVTDDAVSVRSLLRRDPRALLVAEESDVIVGTLVVGWDGWRGNLYRLAVVPGARRRGIARALVEEGERRLRVLGARRVSSLVVGEHGDAVALWRAVGYDHDARIDRFVKTLSP